MLIINGLENSLFCLSSYCCCCLPIWFLVAVTLEVIVVEVLINPLSLVFSESIVSLFLCSVKGEPEFLISIDELLLSSSYLLSIDELLLSSSYLLSGP